MARKLIRQRGIEGCGGASGNLDVPEAACQGRHVDTMAVSVDAGTDATSAVLLTNAVGILVLFQGEPHFELVGDVLHENVDVEGKKPARTTCTCWRASGVAVED